MSESVSSDPAGHSADLRTRIAAALSDALVADNSILTVQYGSGSTSNIVVNCNALADAVIRELESFAEPTYGRDDQWLDADIHIAYDAPGTPIAIEQVPGEVIYVTAKYARKMAAALLLAADKSDWLHDESRWLKENDND